jgi:hypothetical protein
MRVFDFRFLRSMRVALTLCSALAGARALAANVNLTISSNTTNFDIHVAAGSPAVASNITVTINAGVTVGSASATNPALTTGNLPAGSTITIVNNGRIQGAGGNGGSGGTGYTNGTDGGAGGTALLLTQNVTIDNTNGQIWGGGGGGGGSGAYWNGEGSDTSGSGGGGGAGAVGGAGGLRPETSQSPFTGNNGAVGTATAGGAGGTSSWNHNAGAGGGPAQAGGAGSGGCTWYFENEDGSTSGEATQGGSGGAAGLAIQGSGRNVNWLGGASNVVGTNQATSVPAPVITSALTKSGTTGAVLNYTITANNSPTSFSATNLPTGLSVNAASGSITGTPASAGTTNVTIGATNSAGTSSATLVITITLAPPTITSALTKSGNVGSAFSYTITGSSAPTSFSATGLPAGFSINTSTGVISGTPTATSSTNVTIGATNASGTGTATLALTISPPLPAITSALTASGVTGTAFSYTIAGSNSPTSYNATNRPAGLSINTSTGVISGTPTAAGTTNVAISATNASGTGSDPGRDDREPAAGDHERDDCERLDRDRVQLRDCGELFSDELQCERPAVGFGAQHQHGCDQRHADADGYVQRDTWGDELERDGRCDAGAHGHVDPAIQPDHREQYG